MTKQKKKKTKKIQQRIFSDCAIGIPRIHFYDWPIKSDFFVFSHTKIIIKKTQTQMHNWTKKKKKKIMKLIWLFSCVRFLMTNRNCQFLNIGFGYFFSICALYLCVNYNNNSIKINNKKKSNKRIIQRFLLSDNN